jgi:hypothetical protein
MSDEELTDKAPIGGFGREEVRPEDEYVRPGVDAEHEWGVQYQGPFESATDGSARAVRLHARALADTGLPVLLQSFSNTFLGPDGVRLGAEAMDERIKSETHDLRHRSVRSLRLRIKHMVINSAEQLRAYIVPNSVSLEQDMERAVAIRNVLYKTTIVYSVWERSVISDAVASILKRVGECWVPCQQNKQLLHEHGVERVTVVPHPWDPACDMAKLTRREPTPRKDFYAIGLWQPRKHFHETIGAFLLAFKPGDKATLTIKTKRTNFPGYPSPEESWRIWNQDPRVIAQGWTARTASRHVALFEGEWSEDRITRLHFNSNIYVCASRGEAFCLPAFDAKIAGNGMLLVGYNGARDFSGPGDRLIPYEMKPIPKEYGWEENATWAEAKVEDIAAAMLAVEAPAKYERPKVLENFTMEAVGQLMRERCEAVLARAVAE